MAIAISICCLSLLLGVCYSESELFDSGDAGPTTSKSIFSYRTENGGISGEHDDYSGYYILKYRQKYEAAHIYITEAAGTHFNEITTFQLHAAISVYFAARGELLLARAFFDDLGAMILVENDDINRINDVFSFPQKDVWAFLQVVATNGDFVATERQVGLALQFVRKYDVLGFATNGTDSRLFKWLYERGGVDLNELRNMDVEKLLKNGILDDMKESDIQKVIANGKSPLHLAAQLGRLTIVQKFIEAGEDVRSEDADKKTPLHYAIQEGHVDVVDYLIKEGASVNQLEPEGTPLHLAVLSGRKEVVEYLLSAGSSVDERNPAGETPLYLAAELGYGEIAGVLMSNKADVNARDDEGDSLLHLAARRGDVAAMEGLIAAGADVNWENVHGMTPVYRAAQAANSDAMRTLVSSNADVDWIGSEGHPLISTAARHNHSSVVGSLLGLGADPDRRGRWEFAAMHWAGRVGFPAIIRLLVGHGADIEARIDIGRTPLIESAFWGQIESCRVLLRLGADPCAQDHSGRRASSVAKDSGHLALYSILRSHEPKTNSSCFPANPSLEE